MEAEFERRVVEGLDRLRDVTRDETLQSLQDEVLCLSYYFIYCFSYI
jgi:hypothetical protein